ncbi:MAG: class I tRNA ligase family protein, partial [Flavobacteriales bacterium]|nr:class I tRNA ligase family protein [Flavobacteriales bacterium]
ISTMLFDSVAYKNVVSNGLVLDKNGNKMSKRLGNATDPFETLDKYGADACRWYMISNAQPWDNLKFDSSGIDEVQRKFFGTLYNTYSFFALYANIDGFTYSEEEIPLEKRTEIDRWIISELNTLIAEVENNYEDYEPTKVSRLVQDFVINKLSNWHIRLSRRRFWKGEYNTDKISAYQTLYECLNKVAAISSPIAPFFMEQLYTDLNSVSGKYNADSIHLSSFPKSETNKIDRDLEERMDLAQKITTIALSLRKKARVRVRQPLQKIMIPVSGDKMKTQINSVQDILLSELNIKEIEFISDDSDILTKQIKPNFKSLGPKFGKDMKIIVSRINQFTTEDIKKIDLEGQFIINQDITIDISDVEISSADIPGWQVMNQDGITVALNVTLSEELKEEGLARELVNRIQNIRKDYDFEVTDKIEVDVEKNDKMDSSISNNLSYICGETLANSLNIVDVLKNDKISVDLIDDISVNISIKKI